MHRSRMLLPAFCLNMTVKTREELSKPGYRRSLYTEDTVLITATDFISLANWADLFE